jgi:dihydroneopterin aldolase
VNCPSEPATTDWIEVRGLRLWSHVGVLERERREGQWFELSFRLGWDLAPAGRADALDRSLDYSLAITALQDQARVLRCHTLEHWSERILDRLEEIYGPVPIELELRKCAPPVAGFSGSVAVRRRRRWGAEP